MPGPIATQNFVDHSGNTSDINEPYMKNIAEYLAIIVARINCRYDLASGNFKNRDKFPAIAVSLYKDNNKSHLCMIVEKGTICRVCGQRRVDHRKRPLAARCQGYILYRALATSSRVLYP